MQLTFTVRNENAETIWSRFAMKCEEFTMQRGETASQFIINAPPTPVIGAWITKLIDDQIIVGKIIIEQ